MEMKSAIAQASDPFSKKWDKVQIYIPTQICTGYVYLPRQQRVLDMLNGIPEPSLPIGQFLFLYEVEMCFPDGKKSTVKSVCINKANILFIREVEGSQTRGLGSEVEHKPHPFFPKSSTAVRLYMPLYTLDGLMYCSERRRVTDVLNSELRFLALTNVEICPPIDSSESEVSFLAVNKRQIILLEELESSKVEIPVPSEASE